jgi:tetratricopeptide (TPR) repeat protein
MPILLHARIAPKAIYKTLPCLINLDGARSGSVLQSQCNEQHLSNPEELMDPFTKSLLRFRTRQSKEFPVTRRRRHLTVAVATVSAVLLADNPVFAQIAPEQRLTDAYMLEREGKAATAIPYLKSLLDSKSLDSAGVGKAWDVLGLSYEDQGDFSDSSRAFEQSIQTYESAPNHSEDYAAALDDFGNLYVTTGQLDVAVRIMERALRLHQATGDHAGVARSSSHLAGALFSQKRLGEGRRYLARALKESRLTSELDDDDLATLVSLQGWLAQLDGDLPTSVLKYQQSLDLLRKYHGEEHASTGWGYVLLGKVRAENGDLTASLTEMAKGVSILGHTLNSQDPRLLSAEIAYSHVLEMAGKISEAQNLRTKAEGELSSFRNSNCVDCTVSANAFR